MMSGMRNAPPISISSPRETGTSLPTASVLSTSRTAAALLLISVAAAAPVRRQSWPSRWLSRSPRWPLSSSYSRLQAAAASAMAASASGGSGARPRLVCRTVPVRLNTRRRDGCACASSLAATDAPSASSVGGEPAATELRQSASVSRTALVTAARPCRSIRGCTAADRSMRSTDGMAARSGPEGIANGDEDRGVDPRPALARASIPVERHRRYQAGINGSASGRGRAASRGVAVPSPLHRH